MHKLNDVERNLMSCRHRPISYYIYFFEEEILMKMKKALSIALALVFAIGMLAGCSAGTLEETSADISAFVDNDEKLDITWLGYAMLAGCTEGQATELLFEEEFNLNITPVFAEYAKYTDKKNALLQSGDIPDLIYELDPMHVFADARDEFLLSVPYEAIEKYAPSVYAELNKKAPAAWAYTYYDGANYGLPNMENAHMEVKVSSYRKDWLDNLDLEIPKTIDELHDVLYAFQYDDPDGNGKDDTYGYAPSQPAYAAYFSEIYGAYGVLPFDWEEVDGEIVYGGLRDECEDALALLHEWYKEGIIYPGFVEVDQYADQLFRDSKIGYTTGIGYSDPTSTYTLALMEKVPTAEFAYGPIVKGPEGDAGIRVWGDACHAVAFGANGEQSPVKVTRLLKLFERMFTDEAFMVEARVGKEGEVYTIDRTTTKKTVFVATKDYEESSQKRLAGYQFTMSGPTFWSPIAPKAEVYQNYQTDYYLNFVKENYDPSVLKSDVFYKVDIVPSAPTYIEDLRNQQMKLMTQCIKGEIPCDQYVEEFTKIWEGTGGPQMLDEAKEQQEILEEIYAKIGIDK